MVDRNYLTPWNNPMSEEKIDRMISILDLKANSHVVDFGGGNGEILFRIMKKYGAKGVLVENDCTCINYAENLSKQNGLSESLTIKSMAAQDYLAELRSKNCEAIFDLSICIGATHAFGGLENTFEKLKWCTKKNGMIIVGEVYWKKDPAQQYRKEIFNDPLDDLIVSHHENIVRAEKKRVYTFICEFCQQRRF